MAHSLTIVRAQVFWTITGESRGYRPATGVAGGTECAAPREAVERVPKHDRTAEVVSMWLQFVFRSCSEMNAGDRIRAVRA